MYPEKGTGTGFVISPDGEILTNNHVAGGGSELSVTLSDKKVYKARVLGFDPRNDLALIKIDAGRKLPVVPLGDSDHLVPKHLQQRFRVERNEELILDNQDTQGS